MADERIRETMEIHCEEEERTARLMVEWEERDGRRTLVGVECDNPRFADLEPWECHWSCWEKVRRTAIDPEPEP
jgi:hypothetical protein